MKKETKTATVDRLRDKDFEFLDVEEEAKGHDRFHLSATVIHNSTDSVFGISATARRILIVPRYNCTFEAFLDFYRLIIERIDPEAEFRLVGDETP